MDIIQLLEVVNGTVMSMMQFDNQTDKNELLIHIQLGSVCGFTRVLPG